MAKKPNKTYTNWGGVREGAGRPKLNLDPQTRKYYDAYNMQRKHAGYRGIEWQFTFEEWLAWWGDDIVNRGRKSGQMVMARHGDKGPYHPNNVRKATCQENHKDKTGHKQNKRSDEFRELKRQQAIAQHKAAGHKMKVGLMVNIGIEGNSPYATN